MNSDEHVCVSFEHAKETVTGKKSAKRRPLTDAEKEELRGTASKRVQEHQKGTDSPKV